MHPASSRPLIAYVPWFEATVEKGYTLRMREAFGAFGTVVRFDGVLATWRTQRRRLDVIVLNWTDNDLLDRRTRRVALRKVARLFTRTMALRLAARRLIFVRHNVHPHAVATGHERAAERWVDRYERLFDTVLSHSGDDGQRGRTYCPHPLYRVVATGIASPLRAALPARYFVVFGRIVRYKLLERLMTAFPDGETLLVIGAIGDRTYADELARIDRPNVLFRPGLLDEAEAQSLVAGCVALLITHAERDVVVSASFFFALALGVPVVAVATPFLRWVAPRVGAVLSLVPDPHSLCDSLGDRRPIVVGPRERAAIDDAFGDAAVEMALRPVLGPTKN